MFLVAAEPAKKLYLGEEDLVPPGPSNFIGMMNTADNDPWKGKRMPIHHRPKALEEAEAQLEGQASWRQYKGKIELTAQEEQDMRPSRGRASSVPPVHQRKAWNEAHLTDTLPSPKVFPSRKPGIDTGSASAAQANDRDNYCLLYTSPSPRD